MYVLNHAMCDVVYSLVTIKCVFHSRVPPRHLYRMHYNFQLTFEKAFKLDVSNHSH